MYISFIPKCSDSLYNQLESSFECVLRSDKPKRVQVIMDNIDDLKTLNFIMCENSKHYDRLIMIVVSVDEIELDMVVYKDGEVLGSFDVISINPTEFK